MSKARVFGMNRTYIPNRKADMRFNKNIYQKGKDYADGDEERVKHREAKRAEREKYGKRTV